MFKRSFLCVFILSTLLFAGCIITGKVVDENGKGVAGITVTLSGDQSSVVTTDSDGKYMFGDPMNSDFIPAGNYTVAPSEFGGSFTPASASVTIANQMPAMGVNFTVSGPTFVDTSYGTVKGFVADANTWAWKGIPFARPPVGDLRWMAPEDPDSWEGVKRTNEFCDWCPQYFVEDAGPPPSTPIIIGSEDCLYLNVWRPQSNEKNLPVYFWIHGGGNSIGAAALTVYDGSKMASNSNLVVVTTNYRLGPLGWFTHPALRTGDAMNDSGNYGTLDIIMALKWVRANIEAFGGDPDNVTIAGESAGSQNVHSLLLSPLAAGLFHKAVAQSGGPLTDSVEDGDASADEVIDELMAIDGVSRDGMNDNQIAGYLRARTAEEILSVYEPMPGWGMLDYVSDDPEFRNVFRDGTVVNAAGAEALSSGEYNQVPIILGTTKEEHKMFMFDLYHSMDPCAYQAMAENLTETLWNPVVDAVAPLLRQHQNDVYAYRFLYGAYHYDPDNDCEPMPGEFNAWGDYRQWGEANLGLMVGAWHFLDVPFFFGNFEMLGLEPYIFNSTNYPGYELLSDAMMAYVAQFMRTGDPGAASGVQWIPWSNDPGGWKRILFDADAANALTEMSRE